MQSTSRATTDKRAQKELDDRLIIRRKRAGRIHNKMIALVGGRISDRQPLCQGVEFSAGLGARHTRLQTADSRDPVILPRLPLREIGNQRLGVAERHPEFRIEDGVKPVKSSRRNANNCVRPTGKADRFSENRRIRGKPPLPEIMAKHDDLELLPRPEEIRGRAPWEAAQHRRNWRSPPGPRPAPARQLRR